MVGSRTVAAVGLLASLAASVLAWWYFDTLVVFLAVLLVPLLLRARGGEDGPTIVQECPHCGFQATSDAYDYCPRDGGRLEDVSDR